MSPLRHLILVPTALAVVLLSGCTTPLAGRNAHMHSMTAKLTADQHAMARKAVMDAETRRLQSQDVPAPWVAGQVVPLPRAAHMPMQLRASLPVTALFVSEPVDLAVALQHISTAAKINITAKPDALLSPTLFASKLGSTTNTAQAPARVTLRAVNEPLWKLLDDVAAQTQTSWRPTANGAEFYRVVTKTYDINTVAQKANVVSTMGKQTSAEKAFSSDSKTTYTLADSSQLDGLKAAIDSIMSTSGRMVLTSEMLTVTDTEAVHEQVEAHIKKQNKQFSRRVRMMVEAIEVVSKNGSEMGLDWTAVINTASNALSMRSPATVTSQQAGTMGVQQMSGPLAGSGLVVQALNEIGTVVNRRAFPFLTTSGRPITQALRTTFNYVDQVQVTAIASSTTQVSQAPTVTQKEETVGTFLTIVPTAKNDGSIILSVSFDVTSADPLRPFTVGAGASAVTVQQKTINGSGVIQEVPVRSGRTEILGGIEITNAQNTSRRMGESLPMLAGGSDTATSTKSVTVLLVTAVAEDGV